ncbi:hypothetical protein R3P38DRAFT_1473657 [Favolaschia claudopus]|uniref:Uncharacterized protein n=1 Tax=Favolaschia claudopus TaxID=2862362 RepID=A0AAW0DTT4_9AGAR
MRFGADMLRHALILTHALTTCPAVPAAKFMGIRKRKNNRIGSGKSRKSRHMPIRRLHFEEKIGQWRVRWSTAITVKKLEAILQHPGLSNVPDVLHAAREILILSRATLDMPQPPRWIR